MTEPGPHRDPYGAPEPPDKPDEINREAPNPYALNTAQAFQLGTLVGLIDKALKDSGSNLAISPIADHQGNYLSLVRFTLDDGAAGSFSWVLKLVVEQ